MLITPTGFNLAGEHPAPRAENASVFGTDRVTLSPRSASGSWDYNWRPDANPQEDNERIRRINAIRSEIANVEYSARESANKLQQIPGQIYAKENERSNLEREKAQLISESHNLTREKNRMENDRSVAKDNDRAGYPPPPGAYGWGEVINGINDRLYPINDRLSTIQYRVRDIEYAMNCKTSEISQLRNEQSRLNEEVSRTTWFIKERAAEWKAVYASMQNPTGDMACPYW